MPAKKPKQAKKKTAEKAKATEKKAQSVTIKEGTGMLHIKLPSGKIKTVHV